MESFGKRAGLTMDVIFPGVTPVVLWTLGGIIAFLALATIVGRLLVVLKPERDWTELNQRIMSWWKMVLVAGLALVLSHWVSLAFLALMTFLALKEFVSIVPTRQADRVLMWLLYAAIPVQYLFIAMGWYGMFTIFVPVYMFLILPAAMVLRGESRGFIAALATLNLGLMLIVYALGHAAYLLVLPSDSASGAGLLLALVLLTEANDVAQYIAGRLFGRRKITPTLSPNKTVEGFIGGIVVTTALAGLLGPLLTPLSLPLSLALGLLLAVAGFVGDLTMSAIKRDLGLKDTGSSIPGHGGVLDRLDSLIFTAPLFFHFTRFFAY